MSDELRRLKRDHEQFKRETHAFFEAVLTTQAAQATKLEALVPQVEALERTSAKLLCYLSSSAGSSGQIAVIPSTSRVSGNLEDLGLEKRVQRHEKLIGQSLGTIEEHQMELEETKDQMKRMKRIAEEQATTLETLRSMVKLEGESRINLAGKQSRLEGALAEMRLSTQSVTQQATWSDETSFCINPTANRGEESQLFAVRSPPMKSTNNHTCSSAQFHRLTVAYQQFIRKVKCDCLTFTNGLRVTKSEKDLLRYLTEQIALCYRHLTQSSVLIGDTVLLWQVT
jgi:hypothetical protein